MTDDVAQATAARTNETSSGKETPPRDESAPALTPKPFVDALPSAFLAAERATDGGSFGYAALGDVIDRTLHASVAQLTGGLSPAAMAEAYGDWAIHLASSPGKQMQLVDKAVRKSWRFANFAWRCALQQNGSSPCIEPLPQDKRFAGEAWRHWPYTLLYQGFLLNQQWWHNATTDVGGVTKQHEKAVDFASRQFLDMFSPSNFLFTNPEALKRTMETGGLNLVRGLQNFLEDMERQAGGKKPFGADAFAPGRNLATTPGKVVYRNRLMELIQYAPTTETTRPEPVLIVPAWIMKYYILDLSPHNSLVRYLVAQGFTVFMISWKNPGADDRDLDMEDYLRLGVMAALDVVSRLMPGRKIHATGYCLGGTLLSIAAAAMARDDDRRLQSLTLFAAQTDFTEAGELTLFINESQLDFLEDLMWEHGYLDAKQMAGAFRLLRSNDLVWSYALKSYLMGEREPMTDLMAWNADATRMPYKMHSEYLRQLFLNNDLAEGRLRVDGRTIAAHDIRAPIFAVGAERDHVAPWRSVFKIHLLADTEVTFLLTTGGHNAGIVSEPAKKRGGYRVATKTEQAHYADPDEWFRLAPMKEGSWWPAWIAWLEARSGAPVPPPVMGPALCDAPGTYVLQA
ncbi:alpha/beta fold hydrolase [Methylocystis sp. 9N]|uniref:Alpha/beta fold hydrolase n=1 Tax=Methylocystis borbori TaxID=3118750 RepID=A0ABU7XHB3_9HYPH